MSTPDATEQLNFLTNIQQLLNEGSFVATYKYALLMALVDLSVEKGDDSGNVLSLSLTDLAEKIIEYYWRQAIPYPGTRQPDILRQNTGQQAAIINKLIQAHPDYRHSLPKLKQDHRVWSSLVNQVARIVKEMPLFRLQTMGTGTNCFLYSHTSVQKQITLKPGVAFCFRRFHTMIANLIQGAWINKVRTIQANQTILGQKKDLVEFMFGTPRESLKHYQTILAPLQNNRCFYCDKRINSQGAVDHFIPWSRYPVDLGHNFVFSHTSCNNAKSDHLAGESHLAHWLERNERYGDDIAHSCDRQGLAHNCDTSVRIAQWAYRQADQTSFTFWDKGKQTSSLSSQWEDLFAAITC